MSEDEVVKDEDKQCRMESKINSMDARIFGMRNDIDDIGKSAGMNRLITIILWSMGMVIIWFWLSRVL